MNVSIVVLRFGAKVITDMLYKELVQTVSTMVR